MDYTILVGGAAGQGIDTVVSLLERTIKRNGYYVFTYKDFMSMVRGGHNFMQIRFSDKPIGTYTDELDMIFALNEETIELHRERLKQNGSIILDDEISTAEEYNHLPLMEIAKQLKNQKVYPTVGFGAIVNYFGLSKRIALEVIDDILGEKIAEINRAAFEKGYHQLGRKYNLEKKEDHNILLNGNQGIALGAIAAGCKYYCGYPMTPSTSVMTYISSKADAMEIMVDQIEDEVGALNMAMGASYAGVRAMTGSSGGGFALMTEALSAAGMMEIPIVVLNAQRPGPATGLSTRSEQSDLRFVIHAGHGEFPRMVMTLRTPKDAFYQTARAFNIAEKYQIPVILMTEEYLADYNMTIEPLDFSKITIERHIDDGSNIEGRYKRYEFTETGISKRLIPGKQDHLVLVDTHEHNEYGNIDEHRENRIQMVDQRMKKLDLLKNEVREPWYIGVEEPTYLFVCFGATYGAMKDLISRLNHENMAAGALIYGDIWPFPTKGLEKYGSIAKYIINVEQNSTAQLRSLIHEHTNIKCNHPILKYDGRAMNAEYIYNEFNNLSF